MKIVIIAALEASTLGGCATTFDAQRNVSIKSLGNDQYSISEMGVFGGSLPEHAARHCASMGRQMKVQGNTTQQGLASGTSYGVLIFSCEGQSDVAGSISLSINGVSHPILCGLCDQPITFTGEADVDSGDAGCFACGNIANVQEVARIASKYASDEGQLRLNRPARDTARQHAFMNFSGQTEHDEDHLFRVELQF